MKLTKTKLKQIIKEELQNFLNEESPAYQTKHTISNVANKSGVKGSETFMSRGDPTGVYKGDPIEVSSDVERDLSDDDESLSSTSRQATPGAEKKLSGQNWRGSTTDGKKVTGFIQPVDDRAPTNRGMSESQLKQIIKEENSDWRIELVDQEIENRKIQLTDEQKTALYAWAKKQSPSVRRINIFRQKLVSQLKNLPLNEEALDEVFSEKQRRWACAQMNKPSAKISKDDATEMCKSKEIKS